MKRILGIALLIGVLVAAYFYFRNYGEHDLISRGNIIIQNIEDFRQKKGRLPNSLVELEIYDDELFYNKWDTTNYILWYGTSLGESVTYYSDSRKWEDKQRGFK